MPICPLIFPVSKESEDEIYFMEDMLLETCTILKCTPKDLMDKILFLIQQNQDLKNKLV